MNATALVEDLRQRGVAMVARDDQLVIFTPKGRVTPEIRDSLIAWKPQILRHLRNAIAEKAALTQKACLAEYAADRLPAIRLTLRETADMLGDFKVLDAIRAAIQEYQPGGNHIFLKVVTLEGRRVTLEWRALVEPGLRRVLAGILANHALRQRAASTPRDEGIAATR
jgi:tubulysin polyketide synthase-like protein